MKAALVTGASRGIGRACALRLAADGYAVAINYAHNEAEAQAVLDEIRQNGGEGMLCRADVSDPAQVKQMVRDVNKTLGGPDVLVNNAGIVRDEYLLMLNPESLDRCMELNVKGYFYCAQQAVLKMFRKKSGVVVNISSVSGSFALPGQSVYSATKGAVNAHDGQGACALRHPRQRRRPRLHRDGHARRPARGEERGISEGHPDAPARSGAGGRRRRFDARLRRVRLYDRPDSDIGRRTFAMMNIYEVNRRLKQRPPFQMIERVTELTPGEAAVGLKTVSVNDPWFAGHFPGEPIRPGVLIIESCAQLCSLTVEADGTSADTLYVLLKVDQFKFLRPILPGDVMTVSVSKKSKAGPLLTFEATVHVGDALCSKGCVSFTAMPKQNLEES